MDFDWLKLVILLTTANYNAFFQTGEITQDEIVCWIDTAGWQSKQLLLNWIDVNFSA